MEAKVSSLFCLQSESSRECDLQHERERCVRKVAVQAALDAVSVARNDARELDGELRLVERDRWRWFRERHHLLVRVCAAAAVGQRCAKEHTCTLAPSFQYGQSLRNAWGGEGVETAFAGRGTAILHHLVVFTPAASGVDPIPGHKNKV